MTNLILSKGLVSFATAKESAWQKIGINVHGSRTTNEAIKMANLDYEILKDSIYINNPINGEDNFEVINQQFATKREDNNSVLGIVGDNYHVLQNTDAYSFLDPILASQQATLEIAGSLGNGERSFVVAKLKDSIDILGEEDIIHQYILITSSHDGRSATTIMFTPIRDKYNSTLNIEPLNSKITNRMTIKHTGNQLLRDKTGQKIIPTNLLYKEYIEKIFLQLADSSANEEMYEKIIVSGLADTPKMVKDYFNPSAKQSTRFRNNVENTMKFAFSHPSQLTPATNGTLFGAFNAISGYYQNQIDWDGDEEGKMRSIIDLHGRVYLKNQQSFVESVKISNNFVV